METPFAVETKDHGVVVMRLIGTLTDQNFDALKIGVEEAKKKVHEIYDQTKSMVRVLFDISEFTGTYNVGAMSAMVDLEKHNRPYVAKTAIFGGSDAARIATEVTITLIGQPSLKMFKTKEEAEEWLLK